MEGRKERKRDGRKGQGKYIISEELTEGRNAG